jgi:hypothetical protein
LILCRWWIFSDMRGRRRRNLRSTCLRWVVVAGTNGLIADEWNKMTWPRRLTGRIKVRTRGGKWWWPSSVLFCSILMTVETMPIARKCLSCSGSPGTKCNVSESCVKAMMEMLNQW